MKSFLKILVVFLLIGCVSFIILPFIYSNSTISYAKEDKKEGSGNKEYKEIFMVGDSITAGSKSDIESAVSGIKVDGLSSRTYNSGGPTPTGKSVLESNKSKYNKEGNAVIVALGTNSGLTKDNINEIKKMYDKVDLFFVNNFVAKGLKFTPGEDKLVEKTNSALESSGVTVIDWHSKAKDSLIKDDGLGVHPNAEGNKVFSGLIKDALKGGATGDSSSSDNSDGEESSNDSGGSSSNDDGKYTGNLEFNPFIKGKPVQNNTGIDKKDKQAGKDESYMVSNAFTGVITFIMGVVLVLSALYCIMMAVIIFGVSFDNYYITENKILKIFAGEYFIDDLRTYGLKGSIKHLFIRIFIPLMMFILCLTGLVFGFQYFLFSKVMEMIDILF